MDHEAVNVTTRRDRVNPSGRQHDVVATDKWRDEVDMTFRKPLGRILRRMPRMQVYLPEDLYRAVKGQHLRASELLQDAIRAEVKRRKLMAATDRYFAELEAEVGKPTARQRARAAAFVARIRTRGQRRAG